jgi:iron complex outermembrane receptor protein
VHFRSRLDRGVILVKNQLDDRLYKTYLGEPGADHTTIDNQTHQVLLSHTLSADWKLRGQLSYRHSEYDDASTQGGSLQSDNVTYRRVRRLRRFVSDDYVGQADVLGKVEWGGLKQEVLFGVEAYAFTLDYRLAGSTATAGAPFAINIFNPVYGQPLPTVLPTTAYMFNRDHNIAGYAQDILSIGKFRILGSVRVDGYHQDFDNRLVGRRTVQDRTATSPRIGVSYLASPEWTLYANAGNSFRPNDGGDRSGAPFSPETGNSYEAGVKYQSPNGRIGGSIAAFSIRKQNILATDPVNTSFQIALGEVKSEGFDFDLAGQVTEHLRLTASGAYLDTRVSKDSTLPVGALVTNVPHWSSSALAVWEGTAGSSGARFGVGAGPSYVGKRAGNATNSFTLPAFATVRALAYVNYQRWRVSLDADNLFDTHYYESSLSNTSIFPGTLRQVTLRVSASF